MKNKMDINISRVDKLAVNNQSNGKTSSFEVAVRQLRDLKRLDKKLNSLITTEPAEVGAVINKAAISFSRVILA